MKDGEERDDHYYSNKIINTACCYRCDETIKYFIDKVEDLNNIDNGKYTPIGYLLGNKNYEMVKYILQKGANAKNVIKKIIACNNIYELQRLLPAYNKKNVKEDAITLENLFDIVKPYIKNYNYNNKDIIIPNVNILDKLIEINKNIVDNMKPIDFCNSIKKSRTKMELVNRFIELRLINVMSIINLMEYKEIDKELIDYIKQFIKD